MHGDMHEGNYLIDPENDYKVTFFDWDLTSRNNYMVDVGTFFVGLRIMTLFTGKTEDEYKEKAKAFFVSF